MAMDQPTLTRYEMGQFQIDMSKSNPQSIQLIGLIICDKVGQPTLTNNPFFFKYDKNSNLNSHTCIF